VSLIIVDGVVDLTRTRAVMKDKPDDFFIAPDAVADTELDPDEGWTRLSDNVFTRPVVDHILKNYDGVLKIDGEVGVKKVYDPRAWGKAGEASMAARIVEACEDLRSTGTTLRK